MRAGGHAVPAQAPDRRAPEPGPTQGAPTPLDPRPPPGRPGNQYNLPCCEGSLASGPGRGDLCGLTPSGVRKDPWGDLSLSPPETPTRSSPFSGSPDPF